MLTAGIVLGLLLGLLSGGRITNLASIQLRWVGLLVAAVVVRFGTEILLAAGGGLIDAIRLPLLTAGFGLLLTGLWINRSYPGMGLAFVGVLFNGLVIVVNGGYMPIWGVSLAAANLTPADVTSALHVVLNGDPTEFLLNLLILGDVIPIPVPGIQNVASLGDLFLALGLAFFLFASLIRVPTLLEEQDEATLSAKLDSLTGPAGSGRGLSAPVFEESGLSGALSSSAALERPMILGASGAGMASPALGSVPTTRPPVAIGRPSPATLERVRHHPYVRLALNGSFSALWAGQLISLFGDRIHQIALAAVVLLTTGSVLASALVFVAATLPNLFLSPIAGTLVDRWDHKEVLVVSDLLRAATVLLVPIAAVTNVILVYPLVFVITTISIFFRPARVAILPRIVRPDELLSANSALWVGETMADIIGYPLAGLFVVALGSALPVAFWLDAATYVASAALLSTIVVRSVTSKVAGAGAGAGSEKTVDTVMQVASVTPAARPPSEGFAGELKAGWQFLRGEPTLLANTLQATVGQLTVGVLIALTPAYALSVFGDHPFGWNAIYSFIETSQGVGSLVGGFLIGLIGTRFGKGSMIIGGYALFGFLVFLFAMSGNLGLVLGFSFGSGIANMVWLIPSQTLFQERTPPELMGRVVGFRFALVFGSMTLAMAGGGVLAEFLGVTTVIAITALITTAAGLIGLVVPAIRRA